MTKTKISDGKTRPSERATIGKLEVESGTCPRCNHNKLLRSATLLKCAKCKYVIKRFF